MQTWLLCFGLLITTGCSSTSTTQGGSAVAGVGSPRKTGLAPGAAPSTATASADATRRPNNAGALPTGGSEPQHWVGTWAAAPQLTESHNNPPSPGLSNNTLRQIVHVTLGGSQVRLQFSNEFGNGPVVMNSVHIAKSTGTHRIDPASDVRLQFGGKASTTIAAGRAIYSDPVDFALQSETNIAITIAFGSTAADVTGHPGSRTTSYLMTGNDAIRAATFDNPATTDHWYIITRLDVMTDASAAAVVILGDSITDGRGSTTNGNNRWPDVFARRLLANPATRNIAMLNLGIGGNRVVLADGLGPSAKERFDRDVLGQSGVKWIVVLQGVNDLGADVSAQQLTNAYQDLIDRAHDKGLEIYGCPILPFGGSAYDTASRQTTWQTVNQWIRAPRHFNRVIDLNPAVADPSRPGRFMPKLHDNDWLHPNVAGHEKLGEAVDLSLFGT